MRSDRRAVSPAEPVLRIVLPGLVPLLSGLDGLDRVQGVGTAGFLAHRPGLDADCGSSVPAVLMAPVVTPDLFRGPGLSRTPIRGPQAPPSPGFPRIEVRSEPGPRNKAGATGEETDEIGDKGWRCGRPPSLPLLSSCPDLFRASTPRGIAVRAGGRRGGGGTRMPGTSPGMTWWGHRADKQRLRDRNIKARA